MTDLPPPGGAMPPPSPSPPPYAPTGSPPPGWWQASDGQWYPPQPRPGTAPGYGYGYGYGAPTQSGTNGLAIASMVLGILWIYWIGSILAVIFGHISLGQIKRTGQTGRGMAIAGLVLGYLGLLMIALVVAIIVLGDSASDNFIEIENEL